MQRKLSDVRMQPYLLGARAAGLFAAGASLAVLAGWVFNISTLKSVLSGAQTMKVNAALGLATLGLSLFLNGLTEARTWARRVSNVLACSAVLLGALTSLEYATGWNLRIDELVFRDAHGAVTLNPPGRMALATALCLAFLGSAMLLTRYRRSVSGARFSAFLIACLSLVRLVGYLYGIEHYGRYAFYAEVALPTSAILLVLAMGVLCSSPDQGWMATVTSQYAGGVAARRLLPVLILFPIALNFLRWQGGVRGYFDNAVGSAIHTSTGIGIAFWVIWSLSRTLNRLDQERVESYEGLKESEAAFRQLADSMPQMVWTARPDGWLDYCNQGWTDYTGLTAMQPQGWGSVAAIHPNDVARVIETWNRAVGTGTASDIEYRLKRASDGAYRWHLGRGVAMRDESGRIVKWFGTSTDIDDFKRAQQALEEARQQLEARVLERTADLEQSNTLLNAILESMSDGVICVNERYEHVLFNRSARRILGPETQQADPERRAQIFGLYHPDKKTLFKREELPLGRALRGEGCDNIEMFQRTPEIQGGIWLSASSRPVKDGSGRLHGAVLVVRDVTAQKKAEEAQGRLLAILEETTDFVGTLRPGGSMLYANRALRCLLGISRGASLEGAKMTDIYPE